MDASELFNFATVFICVKNVKFSNWGSNAGVA